MFNIGFKLFFIVSHKLHHPSFTCYHLVNEGFFIRLQVINQSLLFGNESINLRRSLVKMPYNVYLLFNRR